MSIWYAQDLACERCHHTFSTVLARGIHARRVPEVREQILAGLLHYIRCPACNANVDAHRDLAYTDFARFHWVHVATPAALDDWGAIETYALDTFDRYMHGGPPAVAELATRFRIRAVFDLDELREKLAIWEAALDDAVIECAKARCLAERPAIAGPDRRIRVRAIEATHLVMATIDRAHPRVDLARWTVPRAIVDEIAAHRDDWAGRMPKLFERGFVSLDRYLRST